MAFWGDLEVFGGPYSFFLVFGVVLILTEVFDCVFWGCLGRFQIFLGNILNILREFVKCFGGLSGLFGVF